MDQNALAKWVLDELNSERAWSKSFAESEDVLEKLADETISEKRKGKTAPVFLDREKTLDKAVASIAEASRNGAGLIAFPEVFIAGYPYWNRLENVFKTTPYFIELLKNSVCVPGPVTDRLYRAARKE